MFKYGTFRLNIESAAQEGGILQQVRATMLATVFVFIRIEGASVYSRYAKERADVGRATIFGFVGVTALMVLVSMLPFAGLPRALAIHAVLANQHESVREQV